MARFFFLYGVVVHVLHVFPVLFLQARRQADEGPSQCITSSGPLHPNLNTFPRILNPQTGTKGSFYLAYLGGLGRLPHTVVAAFDPLSLWP